jgi:hypothetical protein
VKSATRRAALEALFSRSADGDPGTLGPVLVGSRRYSCEKCEHKKKERGLQHVVMTSEARHADANLTSARKGGKGAPASVADAPTPVSPKGFP